MKDYLRNGTVSRSEIVSDVKSGTLNKEDISRLVKQTAVADSFIGETYSKKVDKNQWDEKYLEKLVLSSVAECFNEDYLYYLYDVAKYVRDNASKRKRNLNIGTIVAGIVLLVGVIILIVLAVKE